MAFQAFPLARIAECQRIAGLPPVRLNRKPEYAGAPPMLGSAILSVFPDVLQEFRGNRFSLLWRGSGSDFSVGDFHQCCDGHWNTLTIIADMNWNVFGGFAVPPWEPRAWNRGFEADDNRSKSDPYAESFLFSIRNPYNLPPTKFPIIPEKAGFAIRCDITKGPCFGADHWGDLSIYDRCGGNNTSHTRGFGATYNNTSQMDGRTFFTGTEHFMVREIEVFVITD
jgi:hypothetical protein